MSAHRLPETRSAPQGTSPAYNAKDLTKGGDQAQIIFDEKTYTLRITRAGKLILTK